MGYARLLTLAEDSTVVNEQRLHPGGSSWLMTVVVTGAPARVVLVCKPIAKKLGFSPRPCVKGEDAQTVIVRQRRVWAAAHPKKHAWSFG